MLLPAVFHVGFGIKHNSARTNEAFDRFELHAAAGLMSISESDEEELIRMWFVFVFVQLQRNNSCSTICATCLSNEAKRHV